MASLPSLVRELIDALDDPTLIVRNSKTVAANSAARRLLGQQIEGHDVRIALRHPEALRLIGLASRRDAELVGIGGPNRHWFFSVRLIGQSLIMVQLRDRSESRAAEKMRVDFVANASHELRTPLASIAGYAETLADDAELDETIRKKFGATIRAETERMENIVQDLMSLSRIEADRFRAPSDLIDLGQVIRSTVEKHEDLAGSRNCSLEVSIDPELPTVAGDFGQLCQAADNLLANAIRYGCSAPNCAVIISVSRKRDNIVLVVRDFGEGIPAEHLPRITERFYRVDAARSRDSGGTGLGLAIVKHIVERHRGRLEIKSTPNQGTTVEMLLPIMAD